VLPKSVTPSRIKENFDLISLSQDEISTLSTYSESHGGTRHLVNPPWGRNIGFTDGFAEAKNSDKKQ
jgi:diketogulonate reductase-like aldo/keto reductase